MPGRVKPRILCLSDFRSKIGEIKTQSQSQRKCKENRQGTNEQGKIVPKSSQNQQNGEGTCQIDNKAKNSQILRIPKQKTIKEKTLFEILIEKLDSGKISYQKYSDFFRFFESYGILDQPLKKSYVIPQSGGYKLDLFLFNEDYQILSENP